MVNSSLLCRILVVAAGALLMASPASSQDPGPAAPAPAAPKSILWAKTWDGALREARLRNVPIYILVSIGEG